MNKIQIVFCVVSINLSFAKVMHPSQTSTVTLSRQEAAVTSIGSVFAMALAASFESARIDRQAKSSYLRSELEFLRRMTPLQQLETGGYVRLGQDVLKPIESAEFKLNPDAKPFETEFTRAWSSKQKSMK